MPDVPLSKQTMPRINSRVLILTLGTRGDVQPFITLARMLERIGVAPLLVTLPHYLNLCSEAGVPCASLLGDDESWPETSSLGGGVEDQAEFEEKMIIEPYVQHMPTMLMRLEQLAGEFSPDMVVVGMLIWFVEWLRETLRVPLVHAYLQPLRWLGTRDPLRRAESQRQRFAVRLHKSAPLIDTDFVRVRIAEPSELQLLAFPAGLGVSHLPGLGGVPTGFWCLPYTTDERLPDQLVAFLDAGPPPVCLNFGSMPVYSRTEWSGALLTALERNCHAGGRLLAIGALVPSRLKQWPQTLVLRSAPHALVLPRCACVVHHGGAGTSAATVRARVPSLVVPHLTWIDQLRWAAWLVQNSAGVVMPEAPRRVDDFSAVLHDVQHLPELRHGVCALADQLEADGGVALAVRLIGERLDGGAAMGAGEAAKGVSAAEAADVAPPAHTTVSGPEARRVLGEAEVVELARRVTGDERMGAETLLLELNSLELLELHARLEIAISPSGCTLPSGSLPRAALLRQPTLAALASFLAGLTALDAGTAGGSGDGGGADVGRRMGTIEVVGGGAAGAALEVARGGAGGQVGTPADAWDELALFKSTAVLEAIVPRLGLGSGAGPGPGSGPPWRRRQRLLFLHGEGGSARLQRMYLDRSGWLAVLEEAGVEVWRIN